MDAISLINKHLDVEKVLLHYDFDHVNNENDVIRACCKIHGGNNPTAFAIRREDGVWVCHTGDCGAGDIYTLVQKMEGIDFPSAVRWVANFHGIDINNLQITERKTEYMEELKKFVKTMKGKKKCHELNPFEIPEQIKKVGKYRNFKEDTLVYFNLGYVDSVQLNKRNGEPYTLFHRLVFPIIFNNIQVGISFRKTKSTDFPKWSHQPANLETGELLYNYDNCKNESIITIVEGISDVWAYHEIGVPAVCTFGAHVTEEQYKLLLKTGADLCFSFDGDDAGRRATEKAILGYKKDGKLIKGMFKYKANCSMVEFEEGEDPESISREELRKKYDNRKKL